MPAHLLRSRHIRIALAFLFTLAMTALFQVSDASAVPSFARQTGLACTSCHMAPPELTPFGRDFKLHGYTMVAKPTVSATPTGNRDSGLALLESLPLSAMLDTSFSATRSAQPDAQNGDLQVPQAVSLFLAGAWSSHVGGFVQATYDTQDGHFAWDNTDVRYANTTDLKGKAFSYGFTLNNSPTVEDLWNTTPAWGYPWVESSSAPTPSAAAIINGTLGQDVAGLGAYGMLDNHLYLAGTLYRSQHAGSPLPNTGSEFGINIHGAAPYWRVAWQQTWANNYLEVGGYGMHVASFPGAAGGPEDRYTDVAVDVQDDVTLPRKGDVLSLRGTYIRENSSLNATNLLEGAAAVEHHLNTMQTNAEYHFGSRYAATFGLFNISGTPDPLYYPEEAVTGSVSGDPGSRGYMANVSWWSVQNINVALQYTGYLRFNGAKANYDGAGRAASANNTVYLVARFLF